MRAWMMGLLLLSACARSGRPDAAADLPEAENLVQVEGARAELMEMAGDLDPALRGRALSLLILTSDEPAGGALAARGLWDPTAWVQRTVAEALLQRLSEPESREALEAFVLREEGDPYVRGWTALRLSEAGYTATLDGLEAAWRADSRAWSRAPLALAAAHMGDTEAWEAVTAAVSRGDLALETSFVLDLAHTDNEALLPALKEASEWAEEELALSIAAARMIQGDPAGARLVHQSLTGDDQMLQLEALDYLSTLDAPEALRQLEQASHLPDPLVARYASLVLASRGLSSEQVIAQAALAPDWEVRDLAVRWAGQALSHSPEKALRKTAEATIRQGLLDEDPTVRATAIEALARTGLTGETEALAANLAHEARAVRVEAAGALLLQR